MKQSLTKENLAEGWLTFFAEGSRAVYRGQFEALMSGGILADVVNTMEAFRLVKYDGYGAIYDLRTTKNSVEYSFQVLFVQDVDGIWRIVNF